MEIWKQVNIANGKYRYGYAEVSNLGRVRRLNGKLFTLIEDQDGYYRVAFSKSENGKCFTIYKFVHRLVAIAFIENLYEKPQVNHIDSNKKNNLVENLEWVTPIENTHHAIKHGRNNPKGEANPMAKLKQFQVDEIREKWNTKKYKVNHLAKEYNVSWSLIKLIVTNKIWKY